MKRALIVGIDEYPSAPLYGCVNDASALAELLKTNGDGAPNFDVSLKLNIKTKAELLDLIDKLFSGDADASLLYFSGHGSEYGHLVTPTLTSLAKNTLSPLYYSYNYGTLVGIDPSGQFKY